jgi:hypothetical protein
LRKAQTPFSSPQGLKLRAWITRRSLRKAQTPFSSPQGLKPCCGFELGVLRVAQKTPVKAIFEQSG